MHKCRFFQEGQVFSSVFNVRMSVLNHFLSFPSSFSFLNNIQIAFYFIASKCLNFEKHLEENYKRKRRKKHFLQGIVKA